MVTIYDLLEVSETASKEEITKAYEKMIMEFRQDPSLSKKENSDNELILNKMKIAYEILINDEKRKKYDSDIAKKRAEELIKSVSVSSEEKEAKNETINKQNSNEKEDDSKFYDSIDENNINDTSIMKNDEVIQNPDQNVSDINRVVKKPMTPEEKQKHDLEVEKALLEPVLSKEEQKLLKKAAQKEFNENLKKAKQAEKEYNDAYTKAYNDYLRKNGYAVDDKKYGLLYKIKNISIIIISILIICFLCWVIPPIRNIFINLYEDNYVVKIFVDLFMAIVDAILSVFK